jgi:eukaryotic-like serine/threonine-protein kinase
MVLGGRYRLDERIAGGGMGDVWRGTDEVLGRTVAVKILLPALLDDAGFAERFRGEARTMATINHPGVVDIYDYGSDGAAGAYLVMEYVEGDPLSRTLSRVGRLTPARTMALVAQAADALQSAHDKGIVHRDVKPGNLLVRPNGTLVLTDFGIARSALVGQLTAVGSVLGTASYISPEQASGGVASPLSDVYALGVVAYQCLSGRRPFEGDNPLEIAMKHVRTQPQPLPPDTPPAVRGIVERAMAKDPAARFPSAAALAQVARQASSGLAGGPAGPGPGGVPISVPPVTSQTSPGPMGAPISGAPASPATGGPRPPAPGGTRVMPPYQTGAMGQTSGAPTGRGPVPPRPAGAAAGPGGYNRGAAAVPAPAARRADTGYLAPPPAAGQPGADNRRRLLLAAAVAGVVVLLLAGLAVGWALLGQNGDNGTNGNGGPGVGTSAQPGAGQQGAGTPTGNELVDLQCDTLIGDRYQTVETKLARQGFKIKRVARSGGRKGRVVDVSPCSAAPGSTVTLYISTGQGGSGGNTTGPSAPPSCGTIGAPLECASASAKASNPATSYSSPPAG